MRGVKRIQFICNKRGTKRMRREEAANNLRSEVEEKRERGHNLPGTTTQRPVFRSLQNPLRDDMADMADMDQTRRAGHPLVCLSCSALDAALVTFPVLSKTRATVPSACFLTIQLPSLPRLLFLMFQSLFQQQQQQQRELFPQSVLRSQTRH